MWIVTRTLCQYNQDGDYFVCGFIEKPTFADLKKVLPNQKDTTIRNLEKGGGRLSSEHEWYYLTEVGNGEIYN